MKFTFFLLVLQAAANQCTLARCNQCRSVVYHGLGRPFVRRFCQKYISQPNCCAQIIDNAYGRQF